ncbi:MAG: aminoacetone oxidase family FAD-binding enzyme [Hungatella sp.]|uniref:aminoacetone oxidase family FAD-binding enzyme n=1 Tax=Hungatella sp. TaxID=2613924 RepID=UPI0039907E98
MLAAGSKAAPGTGSDGSGYKLAESLGHSVIEPLPALVQLKCRETWYKQFAGVRTEASVTLYSDGKAVASDRGELQFTDYGISGIPVFQISRFAARALRDGKKVTARLDLLPVMEKQELFQFLTKRVKRLGYRPGEEFLNGVLNKKLHQVLLKESGIPAGRRTREITEKQLGVLTDRIKGLETTVTAVNPFEQAQICCGGVDTREVNPCTMESKLVSQLFLAGEILDVDGICGGYNLQWAWSSGILAGRNAGRGPI